MFNRQQYVKAYLYVQDKLQVQPGEASEEIDGIVHAAEMHFYAPEKYRQNYLDTIISDHKDAEGNTIAFTCEEIKLAAEK